MTNDEKRSRIAVAVPLADEQVLMRRRPGRGSLAGLWEFPGGKIRPAEGAEQAARRELLEETGLAADELVELANFDFDYPDRKLRLHFFTAPLPGAETPAGWRWIRLQELNGLALPAATREAVRALTEESGTRA